MKFIGFVMLLLPVVLVVGLAFWAMVEDLGWRVALGIWGFAVFGTAWVGLGAWMFLYEGRP